MACEARSAAARRCCTYAGTPLVSDVSVADGCFTGGPETTQRTVTVTHAMMLVKTWCRSSTYLRTVAEAILPRLPFHKKLEVTMQARFRVCETLCAGLALS